MKKMLGMALLCGICLFGCQNETDKIVDEYENLGYTITYEVEENLILSDVDVREVTAEDGKIEVLVEPAAFAQAREVLGGMGISEFDVAEITFLANDPIEITDPEERRKFDELCDMLDDLQDVQNVYHNVK